MSLFDSASLCVTPNGVKEGKLYSIKPTDGSGDLSVTRATTATRVNSAGLVEIVPYNLATYSEQFDNAAWTKIGSTITANSVVAPNGTTTADKFESSSAGTPEILQTTSNSNVKTISFYAKAGNVNFISLWIGSEVKFNLSTGTVVSGTGTIESVGNGWYRCVVSNTTFPHFNVFFSATASGQFVYLWGAQLNDGTLKDYLKTETRLNIPRLDYTNGSCPSILVEPQRTNLALRSEEFDNVNWIPASATITANSAISPSGNLNADTFTANGTNNLHLIGCNNLTPIGVTTISIFAKKNTNNFIQILGSSVTFGANVWANFDLNNGVLGSVGSSTTAKIENYGNGWYRCSITGTSTLAVSPAFNISLITSATSARAESNSLSTSVYLWGSQMELGANATSYIPTTSASVTRNADVISKTGISSLIGQTEGTIFVDFNLTKTPSDANGRLLQLWATNDTTNAIIPILNQSNQLQISMFKNSSGNAVITASSSTLLGFGRNKIAVAYTSTTLSVYKNGTLLATGNPTTVFPSSLNSLNLGCSSFANRSLENTINSAALFKTRLTDEQLAQLTTI
jgi:hypothetical protein